MDARYAVVDWYDDYMNGEILGIDLTKKQACALVSDRIDDTDGECDVQVYDNKIDKELYDSIYDRYVCS